VGSEALGLGGERWGSALEHAVVPLVAQLAAALAARSRPDPAVERTLRAAVLLLFLSRHASCTLLCCCSVKRCCRSQWACVTD